MFDTSSPGGGLGTTVPIRQPAGADPPEEVPLERLEDQICELAGHLTATTCRFLVLLGDFDARMGWASWDMNSCSQWLSWKCQMASGTAREHVRVARALRDLPVIRAEFGAGRLSYAKVRALTRIATPQTDPDLAEIAGPMTGNQLERFTRAHRKVTAADDNNAHIQRRLSWRIEDDGSMTATLRLPPLQAAVLLQAVRAATGDLEHPHGERTGEDSAQTQPDPGPTSGSLADALVAVAEAYLAAKIETAANPDVYQVIVHVGTDAIDGAIASGASAETPGAGVPVHPADPARCHVEDGGAISQTTASMLACSGTISWMRHDHDGNVLDVGRRTRRPSPALRRAVRERDHYRCRFPGCDSRRTDLHHIQYWSSGGRTALPNLISLCGRHHRLVHVFGYFIATGPAGEFSFCRPDGTPLPTSPALLEPDGTISDCHDAEIGPDTIIPPWYGERLNLDYAISACFASAAYRAA